MDAAKRDRQAAQQALLTARQLHAAAQERRQQQVVAVLTQRQVEEAAVQSAAAAAARARERWVHSAHEARERQHRNTVESLMAAHTAAVQAAHREYQARLAAAQASRDSLLAASQRLNSVRDLTHRARQALVAAELSSTAELLDVRLSTTADEVHVAGDRVIGYDELTVVGKQAEAQLGTLMSGAVQLQGTRQEVLRVQQESNPHAAELSS